MPPDTKRRCTHPTKSGQPCRAWALKGSDPPTCAIHAGRVTGQGAPPGNRNRVTHGFYADFDLYDPDAPPINGIIQDLAARMAQLSQIIESYADELSIADLVTLFRVHGQNASRLGRLLRDRDALSGDSTDRLTQIFDAALDALSEEWEVEL